jgi:DNA-directed RNA polymerase alpha subunit
MPIEVLRKSKVYPYGLTDHRIEKLKEGGIQTVSNLAEATEDYLLQLDDIGEKWLSRINSVLGQAIWM